MGLWQGKTVQKFSLEHLQNFLHSPQVLPFFKKSESQSGKYKADQTIHGSSGPLNVRDSIFVSPLSNLYGLMAEKFGFHVQDINGKNQTGFDTPQVFSLSDFIQNFLATIIYIYKGNFGPIWMENRLLQVRKKLQQLYCWDKKLNKTLFRAFIANHAERRSNLKILTFANVEKILFRDDNKTASGKNISVIHSKTNNKSNL